MKRLAWMSVLVAVLAIGLVGCDWNTGDDAGSWSSSYNWVNFSGVYRGEDNGPVVTGASGRTITSLVIDQSGQNLTITDSNGGVHQGRISHIRSASGYGNTDIQQAGADEAFNDGKAAKYTYQESPLPAMGDTIMANFECSGVGSPIRIVGVLQGRIVGVLQGSVSVGSSGGEAGTAAVGIFTGRQIDGVWIEPSRTGEIAGFAPGGVPFTPPEPEPAPEE